MSLTDRPTTLVGMRERLGLTRAQAADHLDVDHAQLWQWETGKHVPNLRSALELAVLYGVTVREVALATVDHDGLSGRARRTLALQGAGR